MGTTADKIYRRYVRGSAKNRSIASQRLRRPSHRWCKNYRLSGPKPSGRKAFSFFSVKFPLSSEHKTVKFGANSYINWRQSPHGVQIWSEEPAIAILEKLFFPSLIAFDIAVLSAQIPHGYEAFSMLQPVKILSSPHKTAAPTEYFE